MIGLFWFLWGPESLLFRVLGGYEQFSCVSGGIPIFFCSFLLVMAVNLFIVLG